MNLRCSEHMQLCMQTAICSAGPCTTGLAQQAQGLNHSLEGLLSSWIVCRLSLQAGPAQHSPCRVSVNVHSVERGDTCLFFDALNTLRLASWGDVLAMGQCLSRGENLAPSGGSQLQGTQLVSTAPVRPRSLQYTVSEAGAAAGDASALGSTPQRLSEDRSASKNPNSSGYGTGSNGAPSSVLATCHEFQRASDPSAPGSGRLPQATTSRASLARQLGADGSGGGSSNSRSRAGGTGEQEICPPAEQGPGAGACARMLCS